MLERTISEDRRSVLRRMQASFVSNKEESREGLTERGQSRESAREGP